MKLIFDTEVYYVAVIGLGKRFPWLYRNLFCLGRDKTDGTTEGKKNK